MAAAELHNSTMEAMQELLTCTKAYHKDLLWICYGFVWIVHGVCNEFCVNCVGFCKIMGFAYG